MKKPVTAHINISGPTQIGKSIIADRIQKAISREFGAVAIVWDNDDETSNEPLADWERKMVRETIWVITEDNEPRS